MTGAVLAEVKGPHIDWAALSPLIAPLAGSMIVLVAGLFRGHVVQRVVTPLLTLAALGAGIGLAIWQWEPGDRGTLVSGALTTDTLTLGVAIIVFVTAIATVFLAWRSVVIHEIGGGEFYALLLSSVSGTQVPRHGIDPHT